MKSNPVLPFFLIFVGAVMATTTPAQSGFAQQQLRLGGIQIRIKDKEPLQEKAKVNTAKSESPAKSTSSTDVTESRAETLLKQKGIPLSREGVKKYLLEIHIDEEQRKNVSQLIALLGSEDYQVRQEATKKLSHFPGLPIEEFEKAKLNADPETRFRIEMVARFLHSSFAATLAAVYQYISEKEITGLLPEVVRSKLFAAQDENLVRDFLGAVVATATIDDDAQLRTLLNDPNTALQATALAALYRSQQKELTPLLKSVASDANRSEAVRFEAARSLADMGDKASLSVLISLLESEDVTLRTRAGNTLQTVTGEESSYTGYAKPEIRTAAIEKWKTWLADKGESATLRFPLKKFNTASSYLNGNTLLACGYKNKVIELAPDGTEVWSIDAQGAWSAEKLKNGNVLVACYNQNRIAEFDPAKKEVWSFPCTSPLNVRPLANGNVLISEYSGRRVIEVNRKKEIVWSFAADASCADAIRLPSGNTLIAAQSKIVEVTPAGKVVWEYPTNQPYGIDAMKNGNILIAKFTPGQILEVNRKKEVVWQYDCKNPTDAMQLPNGNILITENTRFIEVNREKEVLWTRDGASCGAARR